MLLLAMCSSLLAQLPEWALNLNTSTISDAKASAYDASGNVYVVGSFTGTIDLDPGPGVFNVSSGTTTQGYLAKYSPTGGLLWANSFGLTTHNETPQTIAVGASGNIYVAGINAPISGSGFTSFLAKFNSAGTQIRFNNASTPTISILSFNEIALDAQERVYVAFHQRASNGAPNLNLFTTPFQSISSSSGFVGGLVSYDSNSTFRFAQLIAFNGQSITIAMDSIDRPVIGSIWTSGSVYNNLDIKLCNNTTGASITTIGTNMMTAGNAVNVNFRIRRDAAANNFVIAGNFNGTVDVDFGTGVFNLAATGTGGAKDLFILRYTNNLSFINAVRLGGTLDESLYDFVVAGNKIMILGLTNSTNYTAGGDTAQATKPFFASHHNTMLTAERVVSIDGPTQGDFSYALSASTSGKFGLACRLAQGHTIDFDPGAPVFGFTNSAFVGGNFTQFNTCQFLVSSEPNRFGCLGSATNFTYQINPVSFPGIMYQWRRNGINIPGATSNTLTIPSFAAADTGLYGLTFAGVCGTYQGSFRAELQPAAITQQPRGGVVCANSTRQLSIATSTPGATFQWQRNGVNLTNTTKFQNVTTPTLTINLFAAADTGVYRCIVFSACNPLGTPSNNANLSFISQQNLSSGMALQLLANDTIASPDISGVITTRNNINMASDRTSFANGAWSFNSAQQSRISYTNFFMPTSFSISVWFKTSATSGGIISNTNQIPPTQPNSFNPFLYLDNGFLRGKMFDGNVINTLLSPMQVNDNVWHHAVITATNNNQRLYVDGELVSTYAGGTLTGFQTILNIGAAYANTWPGGAGINWMYFNGEIDEVRMYSRVLTAGEVAALHQAPVVQANSATPAPYCVGNTVSFTSSVANGNAWWSRNNLLITGANSNNYNLPVTMNDNGDYRVQASNLCAIVNGDRFPIFFNPPSIIQQPATVVRGCIDDNITISLNATSNTSLSYQWQRNGTNITNGGRFSGATTNTLNITGALASDSGNYTCVVSHACNSFTATSTIARVDPVRINVPDPVVALPLNDTSAQIAGSRNNGVLVNITPDTNRFGVAGSAYRFNGSSSRVFVSNTQTISSQTLAISLWFKTSQATGGLLHFSNSIPPTNPTGFSPVIYLDNGRVRAKFFDGNNTVTTISNNQLNDNQWHHIVLTIASGVQRLFVDGELNSIYNGNLANPTSLLPNLHLGVVFNNGWPGGVGYVYLNGLLDDVNIYQTVFNPNDIYALYNAASISREIHPSTICFASNPVLNLTVNSNSPSSATWFRGATSLSPSSKYTITGNSSLTIQNFQIGDTGNYRLRVENSCATINSQNIPLMITPVAITQNLPVNQTRFVCEGRSTQLNVGLSGTINNLQWFRNGIALTNNANYAGVNTNSLTINNMTAALNGAFQLRIVGCPGDTLFSNSQQVEEGGGNLLQDTSIIAWLKLDGNANNSSTRNLTITPSGTLTPTFDSTGLTGAALNFNGTQNITISNQPIAVADNMVTYSIWFRTIATNGVGILGNINPSPNFGYQSLIYVGNDGRLRGKYTTSPGGQTNPGSTQLVNNNVWHHAVLVRNGNTQTMYLNGQVVYTETNPIVTTQATIEIGRSFMDINTPAGGATSNMWRNFSGQLDDLRIYRRALSQQEIQDIYSAPRFNSNVTVTGGPTPCVGTSFSIGTNSTVPGALYAWHRNGIRLSNGPNITGANSNSMTINNITSADSGVYECYVLTAGKCEGGVSPSYTMVPSRKPVFTTQPANVSNCAGQNALFSAAATAPTAISWRWHKNNTPLNNGGNISNATGPALAVTSISIADTGSYYAVATTLFGCADTSNSATLSITSNTTIVQQPQSQTTCTGQRVVFRVRTNLSTGVTYQWRKNGVNIPGATQDSLVIGSAVLADSGQFTVQVNSGCGNVLSAVAQLNVQVAPAFAAMIGSTNQTLCLGRPYNIGVLLNVPAASVSIQWTKDGQNIPGANSVNFSIASVTASDSGDYRCNITSLCGTAQSVVARLNVITDVLTITTQLNDSNIACGTGARTLAVGGSFPSATFTWLRNGSPISGAPNAATYNVPANSYNNNDVYRLRINGRCDTLLSAPTIMIVRPTTSITTVTPSSGILVRCIGQQATFTVTATGHNLVYQWKKDGNNINGATQASFVIPSYTTADAGTYTVEVSGTCGNATSFGISLQTAQPLSVTSLPSNITTCSGNNATFVITGQTTGATFEWRKNGVPLAGGPTGSVLNINNVSLNDTGLYTVMLRSACDSLLATAGRLDVDIRPVFTQNLNPIQSLCVGQTLNLSVVLSGNVQSYEWRKNGITIPNATSATYTITNVTASDAGQYQVIVFGAGNCGSMNSNFGNVSINAPAAITNQPDRITVCTHPTNFTNIAITATGSNLQYQWFRNGVEMNNSQFVFGATTNTLVLPNSVGFNDNYVCRVIGLCNDTLFSQPIAYIVRNSVSFTSQPQNQTLCMGGSLTLSSQVDDSSLVSFSWFRNGTPIASGRTLIINNVNMNDAGDYQLRAQLCGGTFWSGTAVVDVVQSTEIISQSPTAVGGCLGATVRLFAIPNVTNGTLQWRKNGVEITGANEDTLVITNATATDAGNYTCVLTSPCGADSTVPITLTINPLPQPTIVQNGNVLSTQTFNTYQWRRDNVILSGATQQTLTATQAGSYTVTVSQNGCQGTSPAFAFTPTTSLNEANHKTVVSLYPNPTEKRLFIELQEVDQTTIEIYSSEGKLVWTDTATDTKTTVAVESWARGVYFVHIKQKGEQRAIERFVKQ